MFIFVVVLTVFRLLYHLDFFRCLYSFVLKKAGGYSSWNIVSVAAEISMLAWKAKHIIIIILHLKNSYKIFCFYLQNFNYSLNLLKYRSFVKLTHSQTKDDYVALIFLVENNWKSDSVFFICVQTQTIGISSNGI